LEKQLAGGVKGKVEARGGGHLYPRLAKEKGVNAQQEGERGLKGTTGVSPDGIQAQTFQRGGRSQQWANYTFGAQKKPRTGTVRLNFGGLQQMRLKSEKCSKGQGHRGFDHKREKTEIFLG